MSAEAITGWALLGVLALGALVELRRALRRPERRTSWWR
jgi:hypothetical protein